MDRDAGPMLDRMPLLLQDAYLRTVEDYKSLSPDEQGRLSGTLRSLLALSATDQQSLVDRAAKEFGPMQADATLRENALEHSHQTFFKLKDQIDSLGKPAPK
jgi:hypothetical protein